MDNLTTVRKPARCGLVWTIHPDRGFASFGELEVKLACGGQWRLVGDGGGWSPARVGDPMWHVLEGLFPLAEARGNEPWVPPGTPLPNLAKEAG